MARVGPQRHRRTIYILICGHNSTVQPNKVSIAPRYPQGHCLEGCHASPACPSDKSGVKMDICMGHYWIATGKTRQTMYYDVTMRRVRVTIVAV